MHINHKMEIDRIENISLILKFNDYVYTAEQL